MDSQMSKSVDGNPRRDHDRGNSVVWKGYFRPRRRMRAFCGRVISILCDLACTPPIGHMQICGPRKDIIFGRGKNISLDGTVGGVLMGTPMCEPCWQWWRSG